MTVRNDDNRFETEFKDLLNIILPCLERFLAGGKKYMCGDTMTVIDILYYTEVSSILCLTEKENYLKSTNINA